MQWRPVRFTHLSAISFLRIFSLSAVHQNRKYHHRRRGRRRRRRIRRQ